ncbi:MAG: NAD(P)H-dependent oxidoreductase subunit E [Nitrospirae bacterium]|nr:NAD(P)H-dependent oxidoreductase subunit E [Nitrospirota bacterium]
MHARPIPSVPLLSALHAIQDRHGLLPADALAGLARERGMSDGDLADFVSFFNGFRTGPPATGENAVCLGPACVAVGAERLLAAPGTRGVPCQGRCERAPLTLPDMPETPASAIPADWDAWGKSDAVPADPIATLRASGLCGMGGAGFPTWRKWRAVQGRPGGDRVVIVNADEGEPGTFKDRWLLDRHPAQVLAGALLAAATVGAGRVIVYLRNEYRAQERILAGLISRLRAAQRIADGATPTPGRPEVTLVRGGGAYICGQESALIASLEDRRGEPSHAGPYPAESGLWGLPTLVQNVETLYHAAGIARHGANWYADGGGRRLFSVSGAVVRPGVYERPLTSTAADLLAAAGGMVDGRPPKGFIPGGGATGLLPPEALDAPLTPAGLAAWGTQPGTGGLVFLGTDACPVAVAARLAAFFAAESCGQCDPCRLGTARLHDTLTALRGGTLPDLFHLTAVASAMRAGSICGLGRAAPLVVTSLLAHFGAEVTAHGGRTCPAGVCFGEGG